jgi:PAS domain S-box-containing protein
LKQIEEQLQRMTKVFMDGADPIVIRDLDGCVLDMNHETERLFGWAREEVLGKRTRQFLTPEWRERGDEILRRLQQGEIVRNAEAAVRTKAGEVIPVLVTAFALTDEKEQPVAYAEIAKDISQLKRAAEQLEQRNRELQHFAKMLVHDLDAPLRSIRSFLDLLRNHLKDQVDAEAAEYIHFINTSADGMGRLITDLLDFTRLQRQPRAFAPVDFSKVFEQACTNLHAAIEETKAEVTCDPLPTASGNPTQLVRLFQNLIGNAVKYRSEDSPRVHVSCERTGGEWRFSIRDNGVGIDAEHLPRVFDIFYRPQSQADIPGTGIGLATCKVVVECHGGRIWVESENGRGSVFHFTIPA